jgi:hypothetical protein
MDLPSISYDPEIIAFYIRVTKQKSVKTISLGEGKYKVYLQVRFVGLEIILPISTRQEAIDAVLRLKEEQSVKLFQ